MSENNNSATKYLFNPDKSIFDIGLSDNQLLLIYKDHINEETSETLLSLAEMKMDLSGEQRRLKKKVFNILVECIQNIIKHSYNDTPAEDKKSSVIIMAKNDEGFSIISGNYVQNDKVEELKERIDELNQLNNEQLKELHLKIIKNSDFNEKGGAGLGLIDMMRKSGNKIQYDFKKVNEEKTYFTKKLSLSLS